MDRLISEEWEYWVPDPEIEEVLKEEQEIDGFDCLGIDDFRLEKSAALSGIRFGSGNPNKGFFRLGKEKTPDRREKEIPHVKCKKCGFYFRPSKPGMLYCGVNCVIRVGRKKEIPAERECSICGVRFAPKRANHKICTRACACRKAPKTPVSLDYDLILQLHHQGVGTSEISKRVGSPPKSIRRVLAKFGIKNPPGRKKNG